MISNVLFVSPHPESPLFAGLTAHQPHSSGNTNRHLGGPNWPHTHPRSHIHTQGLITVKVGGGMEGVRMKVKETGGHGCRPSAASRRQHSHTNKMKVGATLLSRPQHTALCINMHHQRESRQVLTYHFMVPKAKQRKILLLKTDTTCSKSDTLQPRLVVEHGNTGNLGLTDSKNILS